MTNRIPLDELTSDQLSALYDRIAELETDLRDSDTEANELALHNDETCEAVRERDRLRAAWQSARRRSQYTVWRTTHDRLWTEFGKDRARADTAEAALDRVRKLRTTWLRTIIPLGTSISRWWDTRLIELDTALNGPKGKDQAHPQPGGAP